MASAVLSSVTRTPNFRFWARWRTSGGRVLETDLTETEYRALAGKGAGEPPRRGVPAEASWIDAGDAVVYDSPDGRIPFGGYVVLSPTKILLSLGEPEHVVLKGTEADLLAADQEIEWRTKRFRLRAGTLEAR